MWAWSWQTAAPQSAQMATAAAWSPSAAQSKQFMVRLGVCAAILLAALLLGLFLGPGSGG